MTTSDTPSGIRSKYIFWTTDPSILYRDQKYLDFFPKDDMSRIEQLNSITRFCIYFLILAIISQKADLWIQLPIVIIMFVVILYYVFENDNDGKHSEFHRINKLENLHGDVANNSEDTVVESGYYDSSNNLHVGKYYDVGTNNTKTKYNLTDYDIYNRATCKIPTENNPFMNPTINDFNIESPPQACNVDDDDIKEKTKSCFDKNMFMDVGDVFNIENSQRQFYTVPLMNPNDQSAFANWLYKSDDICKTNQNHCLKYEDIRFKRNNMK
jgi:hypothetical protein